MDKDKVTLIADDLRDFDYETVEELASHIVASLPTWGYSRQEKLVQLDEKELRVVIGNWQRTKELTCSLSEEICKKFGQEKWLDYTEFFHIIEKIIDTHIEYFIKQNVRMIEAEGIYHETSIKEAYKKLFDTKAERSERR